MRYKNRQRSASGRTIMSSALELSSLEATSSWWLDILGLELRRDISKLEVEILELSVSRW